MLDVLIIGAGVSGCAAARELSRCKADILVLDKEEDVCCGTSKANSAIVHAGYDAVHGSLMAKLNVEGSRRMPALAKELDFAYDQCGSLVVCLSEQDRPGLEKLYENGVANGVEGLRIIERDELVAMEPNVSDDAVAALWAPTGGIVCPFGLTYAFAENAAKNGVKFQFDTTVTGVVSIEGGWRVETNKGSIETRLVVNAAGVHADELHNAVDQAVRDERLKTELITNVSHDLKTPITSIITYTDLLSKCPQSDEKAKEYMAVLTEKSTKLARLVEDLIEASKLSSGNITLHPMVLDLGELTAQAIGEYQKEFEENRLQLVLDPDLPRVQAFADGSKTYRVLENLLQNAKKYSAVDSRVYVRVYKQGDFGVFEIKNISAQPLNISPQELTQRFVRGDASRTKEGNGLGLSIAQELCSAQQGKLELLIDGDLFKARVYLPQPKNALPQDTAE